MLGKQDNCQVAVSVSLACAAPSIPVAWQLYLPQEWADDPPRREKAGVPEALEFATKPQIAPQQIEHLLDQGAPRHCVLSDAGYGVDTAFRERPDELGLPYVVGVTGSITVWPPGRGPLPPKPLQRQGPHPRRLRRGGANAPEHRPRTVKDVAFDIDPDDWQEVSWRDGTNTALRSHFARVRVRAAHRDEQRSELREPQWLLIEWLAAQMSGRADVAGVTKTLELFGRRPQPDLPASAPDNLPAPFHVYSMRRAIVGGFHPRGAEELHRYKLAFKLANDGRSGTGRRPTESM